MEIEDEVDILMSSDIMAAQMSTKSITFTRAQTGWIFREDRKVWQYLPIIITVVIVLVWLIMYAKTCFWKKLSLSYLQM
jgi:hypothetical protein